MSDFRTDLGLEVSAVALEIAIEMGDIVTYQHRNDTPIQLYTIPQRDGAARARDWGHTRSRELPRTFIIPAQQDALGTATMFPPTEGPMIDDKITDEFGFIYAVRQYTADSLEAVYTFTDCICTKVKTVGAIGE